MKGGPPVVGLTGVTGLLGGAFLHEMLAAVPDLQVVALVRSPEAALPQLPARQRHRVELVHANLTCARAVEAALPSAARVSAGWWHFAAATTLSRSPQAEVVTHAANADGTARLLDLVRRLGRDVPFFHVSTAYVAGRRQGRMLEQPAAGDSFRNPYERSKARAEVAVEHFFRRGGRGAILRPSIVVARAVTGRAQLPDLCRRALLHACQRGETELVLRVPETGSINLVPLHWVARAARLIGAAGTSDGRIYHLTAAENTRLTDLVAMVQSAAPHLSIHCAPDATVAELPPSSRYLDLVLDEVREYFVSGQTFDRTNTLAVLPPELQQTALELTDLLQPPNDIPDPVLAVR